ncbi:MAG: hypothetical protein LBJ11_09305 [Oscillospiraceae bacterium]|nr:hypothetical protein [Oscillospiraceae bacterium]
MNGPANTKFEIKVLKNYNEYVSRNKENAAVIYYALYDVNGDGLEELFTCDLEVSDLGDYRIYALQDGVAVEQEFRPPDFAPKLFQNGLFRCDFWGDPGTITYYYRFEGSQLKYQTYFWEDDYDPENRIYYRDDDSSERRPIEITQQEYERQMKEIEGNGQVVEPDWKLMEDYKRE